MRQLKLFQMPIEVKSLRYTAKANLEMQSNLSDNIAASEEDKQPFFADEDENIWGDIYDEYEDFDVCTPSWN